MKCAFPGGEPPTPPHPTPHTHTPTQPLTAEEMREGVIRLSESSGFGRKFKSLSVCVCVCVCARACVPVCARVHTHGCRCVGALVVLLSGTNVLYALECALPTAPSRKWQAWGMESLNREAEGECEATEGGWWVGGVGCGGVGGVGGWGGGGGKRPPQQQGRLQSLLTVEAPLDRLHRACPRPTPGPATWRLVPAKQSVAMLVLPSRNLINHHLH